VLTPTWATPPEALAKVRSFWHALGTRVALREAAQHDAEVAWVSHLPHAVAFAYAESLAGAPAPAFDLTGGGFRDFTRIAASDPELWADILVTNRKALAGPLAASARSLAGLAAAVEAGDLDAVQRVLAAAREGLARAGAGGDPGSKADARSGGQPGNSVDQEAAAKE
jgi:prephenate dehydrogenase